MSADIKITAGDVQVQAQLLDGPTVKAIIDILPITAHAQRWGGEIYFAIGATAELEQSSRDVLEAGELAYWPPGKAFCIFFGPTPASKDNEIRAASAVNIVGKMTSDWSGLWDVPDGADVLIDSVP